MIDNITGEAKVFVREYKKGKFMFTMGFGSKKIEVEVKKGKKTSTEEQWINWYVPVNFSKEVNYQVYDLGVGNGDSFDIVIKKGWMSCYKDKDDYTQPVFYIAKATIPSKK